MSKSTQSEAIFPIKNMPTLIEFADSLEKNIARAIIGKKETIRFLIIALLAEGHILLEDTPGVGKTTLIKAIARSLGADFRRIQFTPDVLPSDITGTSIYDQSTGQFRYHAGPVMAHILLADEINRASPKTQSALLECMEEKQITVDGTTYSLPLPFFVMATQNPQEFHGTFPLPESQLDRFMFSLRLGYPNQEEELILLERHRLSQPLDSLPSIFPISILPYLQEKIRSIHVSDAVRLYLVRLSQSIRSHPDVRLGVSPRGTLTLFRAAQALAALKGRSFVTPDDIKELFLPTLRHRIFLNKSGKTEQFLLEILNTVAIPLGQ